MSTRFPACGSALGAVSLEELSHGDFEARHDVGEIPALIKPLITFQGDINYAAGMTVFQLAWHITIVLSVTAMLFGPLGGYLARRYGARLPMILGTLSLLISFELWTRFHGAWVDQTTAILVHGVTRAVGSGR